MQKPPDHAPPFASASDLTAYLYRLAHGKAKYDPNIDQRLDNIHHRVSAIAEDFQAYREAEKDAASKAPAVDMAGQAATALESLRQRPVRVEVRIDSQQIQPDVVGPFTAEQLQDMVKALKMDSMAMVLSKKVLTTEDVAAYLQTHDLPKVARDFLYHWHQIPADCEGPFDVGGLDKKATFPNILAAFDHVRSQKPGDGMPWICIKKKDRGAHSVVLTTSIAEGVFLYHRSGEVMNKEPVSIRGLPVTIGPGRHHNIDLFLADWRDRGPFRICSGQAVVTMDHLDMALAMFRFYATTTVPLRILDEKGLVIADSTGPSGYHYAPRLPTLKHDPSVYPAKRREAAFVDAWWALRGSFEVVVDGLRCPLRLSLDQAIKAFRKQGVHCEIQSRGSVIAHHCPGKADQFWTPDGTLIPTPGPLHQPLPPTHDLALEQEIFAQAWKGAPGNMYVLHTPSVPKGMAYGTLDAVIHDLGKVADLGTSTAWAMRGERLVATKSRLVCLYHPSGKLLDLPALSAHMNAAPANFHEEAITTALRDFCSIWGKFGPFAVTVHHKKDPESSEYVNAFDALGVLRYSDTSSGGLFTVRCADQIVAQRYYGTVNLYDPAGKPIHDPVLVDWLNDFYRPSKSAKVM